MRHSIILCGITVLLSGCVGDGQRGARAEFRRGDSGFFKGQMPPELVSSPRHWVNTSGGVTLDDLRGKVVWLQFNF